MTADNQHDMIYQYFSMNTGKTFWEIKRDLKEIFNICIDKKALVRRLKAYEESITVDKLYSVFKPGAIQPIGLKKYKLFSFGSNMNLKQIKDRCPSAEIIQMMQLAGYKMLFNRYSKVRKGGVASILKTGNMVDYVWGTVTLVSADDIISLDRKEGMGSGYSRRYLKEFDMWYYYVVKNDDVFIQPTKEYLDLIITGLTENCCPDLIYIEKLKKLYA